MQNQIVLQSDKSAINYSNSALIAQNFGSLWGRNVSIEAKSSTDRIFDMPSHPLLRPIYSPFNSSNSSMADSSARSSSFNSFDLLHSSTSFSDSLLNSVGSAGDMAFSMRMQNLNHSTPSSSISRSEKAKKKSRRVLKNFNRNITDFTDYVLHEDSQAIRFIKQTNIDFAAHCLQTLANANATKPLKDIKTEVLAKRVARIITDKLVSLKESYDLASGCTPKRDIIREAYALQMSAILLKLRISNQDLSPFILSKYLKLNYLREITPLEKKLILLVPSKVNTWLNELETGSRYVAGEESLSRSTNLQPASDELDVRFLEETTDICKLLDNSGASKNLTSIEQYAEEPTNVTLIEKYARESDAILTGNPSFVGTPDMAKKLPDPMAQMTLGTNRYFGSLFFTETNRAGSICQNTNPTSNRNNNRKI